MFDFLGELRSAGKLVAASVVLVAASPAALAQQRPLPVPVGKGWKHAQTGVVLMSEIAGLNRRSLVDLVPPELDIAASYFSDDGATEATIYLFRPSLHSVPVWFDRAATMIRGRTDIAIDPGQPSEIEAFAAGKAVEKSGLSVVYGTLPGKVKSTALAIFPVKDWLISARVSSRSLDRQQLGEQVRRLIAAIRLPGNAGSHPAGVPVTPCGTALSFKKARQFKPQMGDILMQAVLGSVEPNEAEKSDAKPVPFCSEGNADAQSGVYRPVGSDDRYWIAAGDAGVSVEVSPRLSIAELGVGRGSYSVILRKLDADSQFAPFNRMPDPKTALAVAMNQLPVSSNSRGTNNSTITLPSK